ncbi:MAG: hypothetical protein ACREID_05220 [Planctomycetota bacterium]
MTRRSRRPELRLELGSLGPVDPFGLVVVEEPSGSGCHFLADPGRDAAREPLEAAGLSLVGAGQALLSLSLSWLDRAGRDVEPAPFPPAGEVRFLLRRREARLVAALLRRHLGRLEAPPPWMSELRRSMEQIDAYLRWEEP